MISQDYLNQLQQLNGIDNFGKRKKLPKFLSDIITNTKSNSILDFGCGVGSLVETLKNLYPDKNIQGFDPGNKQFSNNFDNIIFDLLISTDVLEHIEPEFLDVTLAMLKSKSKNFYHLIALEPSRVFLPDGRNAHLIIENKDWWKEKFIKIGFKITFEYHMNHRKQDRLVNKYFIAGSC